MYDRADLYDLQNSDHRDDAGFFVALARDRSRVLELACGTGILTLPLARSGNHTVGLDLSAAMLDRARQKIEPGLDVTYVQGDMTDFHLDQRFDLVVLGFNAVCHLHTFAQVQGLLSSVKRHLAPGGVFCLDCFVPNPKFFHRDPERWYPVFSSPDLTITEQNAYDPITQINHIVWKFEAEGRTWTDELPMRQYYPAELRAYLEIGGFDVVRAFGDHDFSPLTKVSRFQIYDCRVSGPEGAPPSPPPKP